MNASGRTVTPGDLYAVTVRRGKYQDGVPFQAGQKIQPAADDSVTHILEAFGVSAGGETNNFKRVTDAELRKMEHGAAEGENVAEVAGDGEGDNGVISEDTHTEKVAFRSTYQERLNQTPKGDVGGYWTGQRGESIYVSIDPEVILILGEGKGIKYTDAVPGFSMVANGEVKIEGMSSDRALNFKKADMKLAEELGVSMKEVVQWRRTNKYTWHECNGIITMQRIPSVINSKFYHLGGVAEVKR